MMAERPDTSEQMQPWVERYQTGDRAAWDQAVAHAVNRLRRIASAEIHTSSLHGIEETDDLLDETCLGLTQAFNSGPSGRPTDVRGFFGLAGKKMREALVNLYRRSKRAPPPEEIPDQEDTATGPIGVAAREEAARRLHELVEQLPDEDREAWDLHHYQGLSYPEAALVIGVSAETVKRRVLSARHKLHRWLRDEGLAPES